MRKLFCLLIALLMTVTVLASCEGNTPDDGGATEAPATTTAAVAVTTEEPVVSTEAPVVTEEPQTPNRDWTENY